MVCDSRAKILPRCHLDSAPHDRSPLRDTNISPATYAGPGVGAFNAALSSPYSSAAPAGLAPAPALWKDRSLIFLCLIGLGDSVIVCIIRPAPGFVNKNFLGPGQLFEHFSFLRIKRTKKPGSQKETGLGALEGTRTPDLLIRSQTLYPAELPTQLQVL